MTPTTTASIAVRGSVGPSLLGQTDEAIILEGCHQADGDPEPDERRPDPEGPARRMLVSRDLTGCGNLPQEQTEPGDHEAEAHQSQARPHPRQ